MSRGSNYESDRLLLAGYLKAEERQGCGNCKACDKVSYARPRCNFHQAQVSVYGWCPRYQRDHSIETVMQTEPLRLLVHSVD